MDTFTWGEVIERHVIGDIEIVEYHPRQVSGVRVLKSIDYDTWA